MSNKQRLDEALFDLQLKAIEPCFAWLYLIEDRDIICHSDTSLKRDDGLELLKHWTHTEIIELSKIANKIEILKHDVSNSYPLGLAVCHGSSFLAASGIDSTRNKVLFFIALNV